VEENQGQPETISIGSIWRGIAAAERHLQAHPGAAMGRPILIGADR
jgi:hypothetical protein